MELEEGRLLSLSRALKLSMLDTLAHQRISFGSRIFSRNFGLSIHPLTTPTTLFGDNQAAIRLCQDSTFHARSKHIDVQFHFVRQAVSRNLVKVTYLSTHDMIADVFTKSLDRFKLSKFRHLLGLHPL